MKVLCHLKYELNFQKFDVTYVKDENNFYDRILNKKYDVIILDFDFYPEFINVKNYVKSTVVFLCSYCDDFIFKKVLEVGDYCYTYAEIEKLYLRLLYLKKNMLNSKSAIYKKDNVLYNFNTNTLYIDLKPVKLSGAENELLKTLIKNRKTYLTKEDILMECDGIESIDSVKVLISRLRKLGIQIENQKNLGYKIKQSYNK